MKTSEYIIQITDTHIFSDRKQKLIGVQTVESFDYVLKLATETIKELQPKLICLTGDLAHDCSAVSYKYLFNSLNSFPCKVAYIPGNHDDVIVMQKIFSDKNFVGAKYIELNEWAVILINTQVVDRVHGNVQSAQLKRIEEYLEKSKDKNVIIFTHHPVVDIGCEWLDKQKIRNEKFLNIIEKYKNIRIISSGHVHQESSNKYKHINMYTTPSTCFQFKRNSQGFAIDNLTPGFRIFKLMSDGKYTTEVKRIENNLLNIDNDIKGYK